MSDPLFSFRVVDRNMEHVRVTLFTGEHAGSRANCGTLTLATAEWRRLKQLLDPGPGMVRVADDGLIEVVE